jgi:PKD repeat protein
MRIDRRGIARVGSLAVVLAAFCVMAPAASALLVQNPDGQILGITLHASVSPASIPGSLAGKRGHPSNFSSNGNVDYNGGAVLHSTAPYLIFWDPASKIPLSSRTLMERYFTDVAADSGKATNVYSVVRQYTDSTGFADYQQSYSAGHAIVDTHAYPAQDTTNCPNTNPTYYPTCVTDAQEQAEVARLIAADSLPTGSGANAPIYFVVTPDNVNECSDITHCASNTFCAYHSSFTDGSASVLYAAIPMLILSSDFSPKDCQADNTLAVQKPNGDLADVVLKYMSHEDNETITDPFGNAWWDTATGSEIGDNCNATGSVDFTHGTDPNAFLPTLGGSSSGGTLYDQLINGHQYYLQSEWSDGNVNCEMQPSAGAVVPSFTAAANVNPGASVSFNPSASSSSQGYTSTTWNFGDGSATTFNIGAPTSVSHTFATPGVYTVSLTLVDTKGNLATASHIVTVGAAPTAAFTQPPAAGIGRPVSFDAASSSDPNSGGSIASYRWTLGDSSAQGFGETLTHTYLSPGTYTVTLQVTDNFGLSSVTVTHHVTVAAFPTAAFGVTTRSPVDGAPVSFNGGASSDPNAGGKITSYSWTFGDGSSPGSGLSPKHTFKKPGAYAVVLTVTDSAGLSASTSHVVRVAKAATLTQVSTTTIRGTEVLVLKFSGPGVLTISGKHYRIRRAGAVKLPIKLTSAEKTRLRRHHKLQLKFKLKFVPTRGPAFVKTETVTLKG